MVNPSKTAAARLLMAKGPGTSAGHLPADALRRVLREHYQGAQHLRRGICLLNAGQYEAAERAFFDAEGSEATDAILPSLIAASLLGQDRPAHAAAKFAEVTDSSAAKIRQALALRAADRLDQAIRVLREAVSDEADAAELHFQLGTLLATSEALDEAELRFTQALNLEPNHVEAAVSLALCCGARGAPGAALKHLQRAQERKPFDGRIGFLLAQAAKAVHERGQSVTLRAVMPSKETHFDDRGIETLSRVIESEPDFVDAFLSIPVGEVDETVFAMLLRTIELALERQPEHAELHYHCGRVLERLGRRQAAIDANERAVGIDPEFTLALIELGRLYQKTDRTTDATTRLEQAVGAGAEYADVYFLLGNLYRDQGQIDRARTAYRRALTINERYEAAQRALAALPV